ncbi:HARBI1 [Mytilus edulis]|uniref:HARBI1 n=1 Tax=Mytilus edulis TaxID=6550 RepID=A0A8S3UNR9_MYTED|nr:HARBI1 [Mytilus edulis]
MARAVFQVVTLPTDPPVADIRIARGPGLSLPVTEETSSLIHISIELFYAAEAGDLEKVRYWLAEGADLNSRDGLSNSQKNGDYTSNAENLSAAGGRALGAIISKIHSLKEFGIKTYEKLYVSCIVPILDYCSSVWGFKDLNCVDTVQNKAIRYFLGVHKFAPKLAINGDVGWLPSKERRWCNMVRYWNRLMDMDNSRLCKRVFLWDYELSTNNWSTSVRTIMSLVGMDDNFQQMLKCDVNSDNTIIASFSFQNGYTPLYTAVKGGFINIVKLLLDREDIDPNKKNVYNGDTSLHSAARCGHLNIVQLLLERADIDPNRENKDNGDTPLHSAVSGGNVDIIKFLLKRADIDPNRKNKIHACVQQVCIALRFYASGSFLQVIGDTMGYDKATVSRAVNDVTNALLDVKDNFIQWPKDINSKNRMKCGFHRQMNFPNVLGCIDCTHIKIQGPSEDEAAFVNRKGFHSVNVQAGNLPIYLLTGQGQPMIPTSSTHQTYVTTWRQTTEDLQTVRMKPEKVCRVFGACAVLHNIALTRNEPLEDVCGVHVQQDQPVQVPNFEGEQDGRHIREHIARVFFN